MLVEIEYGSKETITNPLRIDEQQLEVTLATLVRDQDQLYLDIEPDSFHEGRSFAVFVRGDLAINETIQGPVQTQTE